MEQLAQQRYSLFVPTLSARSKKLFVLFEQLSLLGSVDSAFLCDVSSTCEFLRLNILLACHAVFHQKDQAVIPLVLTISLR